MVIRTRTAGHDHRPSRALAAGHASGLVHGERPPARFTDARYSGLSAGVPGTVRGWERALDEYGTWTSAALQRHQVARKGFVVDQTFVDQTTPNVPWFDDVPSTPPSTSTRTGPRGTSAALRNPDLAKTYDRIASVGRTRSTRATSRRRSPRPSSIRRSRRRRPRLAPGPRHDEGPRGVRRAGAAADPVRYRGLDVYGMGPPSSGGSTVGEALNILEGYDALNIDAREALHLFLEASRFASPTATPTWPTPRSSTSRCGGCCPTASRPSAAPSSTRPTPRRARSRPATPTRTTAEGSGAAAASTEDRAAHDAPRRRGRRRQRRLLHVHDRVDRRQRHRRPGSRLPAQQRADRFQFRLDDAPQPRRRPQAPAQLDEPDDRRARRQAVPGRRLAGRLDDHHDGPAGPARAHRPRPSPPRRGRRAARHPARHEDDARRGRLRARSAS